MKTQDVIKLLPDSVANQIAAGEVIQRPASVIKELVENAIDAGAKAISIILKDAGRTLIQVVDDGCGMSPSDARMAFERHATSKIASATDIYALHTMGFRGEALPSIAAVAQIDMRTMRHDDTMGCRVQISESKFEGVEPVATVPGTNIMVKNIFFHMPARRKFLKKDSVELGHILREFERLALVNPNVDFTLIHNDVTLHQFQGGTLKQRISDLFGKSMISQLAPIGTETGIVRISGFVGLPSSSRKRGYQQFFFVNGRNMRHPFFHKAVMTCFDRLIASDSQPSYFINFEVDPSTIDVNIHPQKHEIKFENEQAIWQILTATIRETLGKAQASGAIDFDVDEIPDIPIYDPKDRTERVLPDMDVDSRYNPFNENHDRTSQPGAKDQTFEMRPRRENPPRDWEKLYENFERKRDESLTAAVRSSAINQEHSDDDSLFPSKTGVTSSGTTSMPCIQVRNAYIASPSPGGIMLVDQHRAHIRILYERFKESLQGGSIPSQQLIFPESISLSPSQSATLMSIHSTVSSLGFDVSFLGGTTWAINGQPVLPGIDTPGKTILAIIEEAETLSDFETLSWDELLHPVALAMARSCAIRQGRTLTTQEMDALLADLMRSTTPDFTPDGAPIIATLPLSNIQALFE